MSEVEFDTVSEDDYYSLQELEEDEFEEYDEEEFDDEISSDYTDNDILDSLSSDDLDLVDKSKANQNLSLQTVDFKAISPEELLSDLHQEVNKLSSVLNLVRDECYILLNHYNWNSEKLMEQIMDNFEETRLVAGLPQEPVTTENSFKHSDELITCPICCDDKTVTFSLSCGHSYCDECYIYYMKEKVFAGARLIKCPDPSCRLIFRPVNDIKVVSDYMIANSITADVKDVEDAKRASAMLLLKLLQVEMDAWTDSEDEYTENAIYQTKKIVVETSLYQRYEEVGIKSFVESHSNYKWCPSPDCGGIVSLENVSKNYLKELSIEHKNNLIPIVSCPFGHSFCFICNYENHLPVPCWITKLWVKKCKDDSETANWINANTKSCPKCDSIIEKNGGCNHMTCKKCKYEFCWICMGVWSKHGSSFYNCLMFTNDDEAKQVRNKQEASKASLKRYLHYYNHFTTQEQSMKGDTLFCADIENKLTAIQEDLKGDVSWIELQFYKDCVNILLRCRRTLKWSYLLLYYLENSNFTTILTDNQLHLSNNVEKLSKLFEIFQPEQIMSKKREFNGVADYLLKREKLLIECAIDSIMKGDLKFNVDEQGNDIGKT